MPRFTADDARSRGFSDLDERIERAVNEGSGNSASIRVYIDDWFCRTIETELEDRGFINIRVPDICLKGDVYFEWATERDDD